MIWIIVILLTLLIISVIFGVIQLKTRLKHESVLVDVLYKIDQTLGIMRKLDLKGAFQAHDVVGQTFMLLTVTIEELRNYFIGRINQKNGKEKNK